MPFPDQLIDGYRAFLVGRLRHEQDRYLGLAESGQSPQVMVIGCCDSRVSPEVIFDARPGELFVVRNIGNLVPPYTLDGAQRAVSAALEFAVQALKACNVPFASVNIFEDEEVYRALPKFANWPTFPQLYVKGELIGGCDITLDLFQSGELQKMLSEAVGGKKAA